MVNRKVAEILTHSLRGSLAMAVLFGVCAVSDAQTQSTEERDNLHEPVFRVSKAAKNVNEPRNTPPATKVKGPEKHPLDEALAMAQNSLDHIDRTIQDYTCTLIKRERVNGELLQHEFMFCKVRHSRVQDGRQVPFSVYLHFNKPTTMARREVLFVEGMNDGKFTVREGGFRGKFLPTVSLLPTSTLAMNGNRYPITEIGIKTLTKRLIEKGQRDRNLGMCKVRTIKGAKIDQRPCTMLEVRHDQRQPQFDFHLARVFVDDELNVPIRYEAYDWPKAEGVSPELIEEYTYKNLKVNQGLTDTDFSTENPAYRF